METEKASVSAGGTLTKLQIIVEHDYVVHVQDFISYDINSLVGEVGGTLGLLLGISMAHIFAFLHSLSQQFVNWMGKFKKKPTSNKY